MTIASCTAESDPDPEPSSTAVGECLGDVGYHGLPVQQLNLSLPIDGVQDAFVQYELAVGRGSVACAEGALPVARNCPVPQSASEDTIDVMLDRSPDELTEAEFARGATVAITEMVTGRTDDGGTFQYRMTAWHYSDDPRADTSLVLAAARACAGSDDRNQRITVNSGGEPILVAWRSSTNVFLVESIENVAPDGTIGRISDTPSGLLPDSAVTRITEWWTEHASDYMNFGSAPT